MHATATPSGESASFVSPKRIIEMVWDFAPPMVLEAAVRHRVFDTLDEGPKTLEQVAAETGCSVRGLRAILDALTGMNFLRNADGQYSLTPESSTFLVSSRPAYYGGYVTHISRMLIPQWLHLNEIVLTGKPDRPGMQNEETARFFCEFVEDLFPLNYPAAKALADHLAPELESPSTGGTVKVLDVAAGAGVWGVAFAQKIRAAEVTAVDFPAVAHLAMKSARRFGVADRYRIIEGDMFDVDFGAGYSVAVLGHVLHCEGEARARRLLRKVFDALAPGGTIAIAEFNPDEDRTGPVLPLIFAVNMLVNTEEGDTYTFGHISNWLREAGFETPWQLPAPAPSPLVLARKGGISS